MTLRNQKAIKAVALLLVFSIAQVYVQANSAVTSLVKNGLTANMSPQAITARLTTRGNQPILVNGNNVSSGGTLLSGATIETPDNVGATIDLGPLGSVDLAPNTKIELQFENGKIKVKIIQGCAIVKPKKGTAASVDTDQGTVASSTADGTMTDNNGKKIAALDVCFPAGSNPIVGTGAAMNAGAGAGGGAASAATVAPAVAAEEGGRGTLIAAILGGVVTTIVVIAIVARDNGTRNNPSPARP
jgi:hypothetical protein